MADTNEVTRLQNELNERLIRIVNYRQHIRASLERCPISDQVILSALNYFLSGSEQLLSTADGLVTNGVGCEDLRKSGNVVQAVRTQGLILSEIDAEVYQNVNEIAYLLSAASSKSDFVCTAVDKVKKAEESNTNA